MFRELNYAQLRVKQKLKLKIGMKNHSQKQQPTLACPGSGTQVWHANELASCKGRASFPRKVENGKFKSLR